jgi:hypothetical protein
MRNSPPRKWIGLILYDTFVCWPTVMVLVVLVIGLSVKPPPALSLKYGIIGVCLALTIVLFVSVYKALNRQS